VFTRLEFTVVNQAYPSNQEKSLAIMLKVLLHDNIRIFVGPLYLIKNAFFFYEEIILNELSFCNKL